MARTNYLSIRWRTLYTRPTRLVSFFHSASSLEQQSKCRHVARLAQFLKMPVKYGIIVECFIKIKTWKLQLDAARIVSGLPIFAKTDKLYSETEWATLSSRRHNRKLQLFYNIKNGYQIILENLFLLLYKAQVFTP